MSEGNERFMDPNAPSRNRLSDEGPEVEGHKKGFTEDMPGKKGLTEDDGPEVEGHAFRDKAGEAYKKG